MATAELRGAAGGGGRAVAGNDDADEVGGIGRSDCHCDGGGFLFAGFTQRFDGLWKSKLFTLEAGNEAAAAHDAACFEAAEHTEELAPAGHGGFALQEVAEDDAIAPEQDESGGFDLLLSLFGFFDRGRPLVPRIRDDRRLG